MVLRALSPGSEEDLYNRLQYVLAPPKEAPLAPMIGDGARFLGKIEGWKTEFPKTVPHRLISAKISSYYVCLSNCAAASRKLWRVALAVGLL